MAGAPFKVKAVYEYTSQESDDLNFPLGQIITVTEEIDADWYEGEFTDVNGVKKSGIFPNNFVEKYEPEIPSRPSRPARQPKDEQAQVPSAVTSPTAATNEDDDTANTLTNDTRAVPPVPATSKPPAAVESAPQSPPEPQIEPVTSPKPAPVEPLAAESKKPPPVAPKSNAFKDRIAAFNQPAAAPILPFQPGHRNQPPSGFIKKPFVAPPPSKDAYVPAPKQEAVIRPYHREEDPEIRQRQEEDQAAAQAAGLTSEGNEAEEDEDVPKPQSLKDRIAMLQKQQAEQAQRRAEGGSKKEKKPVPPAKKSSQTSQQDAEIEEGEDEQDEDQLQRYRSPEDAADDNNNPQRQRLPSAQRRSAAPHASAPPPVPQHEILSGGEEADQSAAEETTDDAGTIGPDDADSPAKPRPQPPSAADPAQAGDDEDGEDAAEGGSADEEDDLDDETRRRLELRERMAKMSGGMGMPGMFGPPGVMPAAAPPKKRTSNKEKRSTEDSQAPASPPVQHRMVPMPGIPRVTSPDPVDKQDDTTADFSAPRRSLTGDRIAPPPNASQQSRPTVPSIPTSTSAQGYESDDDEAPQDTTTSADTPHAETPLPPRPAAPPIPKGPAETASYFAGSAVPTPDSRAAQESSVASPRPPPPPPPTAVSQVPPPVPAVSRVADERGESEYEGDYDTDIASSAKRKDALRSHGREPSFDDSTTADEMSVKSPITPHEYSRPPPPPPQASRPTRTSADLPRAPPPVPPSREAQPPADDDDYDPYRYTNLPKSPPPMPETVPAAVPPPVPPREIPEATEDSSDDLYSGPPPARKSTERAPPPPPPETSAPLPVPPRAPPRQSLDASGAAVPGRRSIEQSRASGEHGQIASDIDLAESTPWWTEADPLPPVLQERRGIDILSESEESTTSKRGGRTTVSKDIYVLYLDYSQTIITARYDARDPTEVSLEQRHEPPPAKLRQDQLESVWSRFGAQIAQNVDGLGNSKKDAAVGDGSSASLVFELIKSMPEALLPVGTRAYGAPVYANLANASVMQYDEIRAGDIVTLRNAKLEGKHSGGLHQKYKQETGALHVAIVHEWDGTKKKIRVWEQGREKKGGLRSESYRLGDLKSGEVRVWRVVGRDWVGWDGNS